MDAISYVLHHHLLKHNFVKFVNDNAGLRAIVRRQRPFKLRLPSWLLILHPINSIPFALAKSIAENDTLECIASSPAAKIQAGLDIAWQTLFPILPYIIAIAGLARVAWMVTHKPIAPEYPVYTCALSTIAAAVWLAVRSREVEPTTAEALVFVLNNTEPVILMTFLGLWSSFVADSQRFVERKALYVLLSVFVGGIAGLLIAALTFISEPKKAEAKVVIDYEHRAGSLIPLTLGLATSAAYIILRYCMDAECPDSEAQRKINDGYIAMQDLEERAVDRPDAVPVVGRDSVDATAQHDSVSSQTGFAWRGGAALVDSFTLDNSIASDDGRSSNGDMGLMSAFEPNGDAATSAIPLAAGVESR